MLPRLTPVRKISLPLCCNMLEEGLRAGACAGAAAGGGLAAAALVAGVVMAGLGAGTVAPVVGAVVVEVVELTRFVGLTGAAVLGAALRAAVLLLVTACA